MIRFFKFVIMIFLTVVVAVFAANNNQAVSVNLHPVPMQFEISLFVVVFAAIIIGVILSGTITSIKLLYWRRVAKAAQQQIKKLEKNQPNSHKLFDENI